MHTAACEHHESSRLCHALYGLLLNQISNATQRQSHERDKDYALKPAAVRTVKVIGCYALTKQQPEKGRKQQHMPLKFDVTYKMPRETTHIIVAVTRYSTIVVLGSNYSTVCNILMNGGGNCFVFSKRIHGIPKGYYEGKMDYNPHYEIQSHVSNGKGSSIIRLLMCRLHPLFIRALNECFPMFINLNNPYHPLTRWDTFISLLVIFTTFTIPLRVGFEIETSPFWNGADWFTDVFYLLDMCSTFRTAYLDELFSYVTIPQMIARRYICGWFALDVIRYVDAENCIVFVVVSPSDVSR